MPSWEVLLDQAMTKSPSTSIATDGFDWVRFAKVLTWNSPPSGTPVELYRCA